MPFKSLTPDSEFLRKHVAYYYSDGSDDRNYRNSYLFYPHVFTTLSFYRNAEAQLVDTTALIRHNKSAGHLKLVTQQSLAHRVTQTGITRKIAIVFKPLGLNRFVKERYSQIVPAETQLFVPHNAEQWDGLLENLFDDKGYQHKAATLDEFLLGQYNGYENQILEKAVALLSDVECDLSISEIAEYCRISRKTLLRYFKSELRTTPELFRMIVRFRHALNEKVVRDSSETLTKLACQASFFDQSHFNKQFKRLTGVTPMQFFREGIRLGQEDTFWTMQAA